MFRILKILADNWWKGPVTVRLPGSVPVPPTYHGQVALDSSRCLACGVCAYVCVSDAIRGVQEAKAYVWHYEPGRCAFCARCVDHCPGFALSMSPSAAPVYGRPGELAVRHSVPFPPCPECGTPTRPVTEALLSRAFNSAKAETRELVRMCERCRRRRLQKSMVAGAYEEKKERRK